MLHFLLTFHMTTGNRNNGREGRGGGGVTEDAVITEVLQ